MYIQIFSYDNVQIFDDDVVIFYAQERFMLTFCGSKLNQIRFNIESKLKDVSLA